MALRAVFLDELDVLLVDDVSNTGQTLARCAALVRAAGGRVLATAEIYDRMEAVSDAGVQNYALAEYKAPENYPSDACPLFEMCALGFFLSQSRLRFGW